MWTSTTTWDAPEESLDEAVEKTWFQKKVEGAKRVINKGLAIGMVATMPLTGCVTSCKPEPIKPDQDYSITVEAMSSLDKIIEDGTTAWFVEEGRTDTIFANTKDEKATLKVHADEGRTIEGTAGIDENGGHDRISEAAVIYENTNIPLIMQGKLQDILISYVVTASGNPVTNALIVTPQETVRTNAEGEATVEVTSADTDQYNNISHTLEGTIESDGQTSIQFDPKTFSYVLVTPTYNAEEDVNEKEYTSNVTTDGNLPGALLYVINPMILTDTLDKAIADALGDATFTIKRTIENYDVIVGGNKEGYVKDEETITLNGNNNAYVTLTLNPASFTQTGYFNITSSEPTKNISGFRGALVSRETATNGDTLAVANFVGNTGTLEYDTNNETEQVEIVAIPANHQVTKENATINGSHTFNATATIMYKTSIAPIKIVGERGLPINGVSITGFDDAEVTDADGKATLEMLLDKDKTDAYGAPYASYTTVIALASNDIINKNVTLVHTPETNAEQEEVAQRTAYPYSTDLSVTSSNPAKTPLGFRGALVVAGDTTAVQNFTGTNGQLTFNYATPTIPNAEAIVINVAYHTNPAKQNVALDGDDEFDFVANAISTYFNVSGNVSEEGTNNPMAANVATEGRNDDTDGNGDYVIPNVQRRTGVNNQPLTYIIDLDATGAFTIITKQATADGSDLVVDFTTPATSHTHNIKVETYGPRLTVPVTEGNIEIITLSDGTTHTTPIDSDGITDIVLEGPYETNEPIRIKISENGYYSTGTFALLQNGQTAIAAKIGSRIGLPGYINHDLETTIDDVDEAVGVYASMFADSLLNNNDIMESLNQYVINRGLEVWLPRNGGIPVETITLYNKTTDGQGIPVSQERIDRQKEALDFIAAQNTTGAGKILYNTTHAEGTGPSDFNAHVIMYQEDGANPGNSRVYNPGTDNYEIKATSASTRSSNNTNVDESELVESLGLNDTQTWGASHFIDYNNNKFTGEGEIIWTSSWMYQPADFKK